jgi:uncharacterized membrane protein YccC
MRALRATIVVPGLFALTFKIIGDLQMAIFAVFGSFATLVMASFGGSRRDKAIAHLGLALVGSAALAIGTLVSGRAWLASLVTIPVAFLLFFAGAAGPNAAFGVTAALLAYVLPVASAGTASMIPARLAGWWLALAVSTAAVLMFSPRSAGDRLRAAAVASASALASYLAAAVRGEAAPGHREASLAAKHQLLEEFSATPYRPTGLAAADQALARVVHLLEWCTALAADTLDGRLDLRDAEPADRQLLVLAAGVLNDVAAVLSGADARPGLRQLAAARAASAGHQRELCGDPGRLEISAALAVRAQAIAVAASATAADALVAAGRASARTVSVRRLRRRREAADPAPRRRSPLAGAARIVTRNASLRSVWFLNSARGALALAAAVAVADLSGVQHGFWVVLGTLSVLRTSAASTGSTALRALAGTVAGFAAGAALLLAIGTGPAALWAALPVAVLVAAYAPGTAPFVVGQAAFTVTVVVLFNLLAPAGWRVGLLRIQDVAIGCAVSLVVGLLFWPRGAAGVVGDDLADAFRRSAAYLTQAVDWALGLRPHPPDAAVAAATAGIRLDDALRGFLSEQGTKRIAKHDLWSLVMGTMRIRLTASSLEQLSRPGAQAASGRGGERADLARAVLSRFAMDLAAFYERVAALVGKPGRQQPVPVTIPALNGLRPAAAPSAAPAPPDPPSVYEVREYLHDLGSHCAAIAAPAAELASVRRLPWWR